MKNIRFAITIFLVLIAAFIVLAGRCFYLQLIKSEKYCLLSKGQQRVISRKPQRGVIVDCRGRLLAASNQIHTIFAEPRIIKDPENVSVKLAPIVKKGAREIYETITGSKNPGFAKLKTSASDEQCSAVRKLYGIGDGIDIQSQWQRYYPAGSLAAHVVGFTGSDNCGLAGIELQYDKMLAGTAGSGVFLADIRRRPIKLKEQNNSLNDGVGIILTVDAAVQQFARTELLEQFNSYQAQAAVAIVAEPTTGAILAMVSLPDFEPEKSGSTDPNCFYNQAVTAQFEPGSVIKPVIAAIALDEAVIEADEKIFCERGNYHGRGFGRIGEYGNRRFGKLNIKEILVNSSNIGMAKIGQRLGKDKLYSGLRRFGFGGCTGLDLPGEAAGFLQPPGKWTGYSTTRIPFGQEISVTTVQLVKAFCTLANGGRAVKPFLVKAIIDSDGEFIKLKRPGPSIGYVVKPDVADWVVK